jgi:hypothetical protein
MVINDGIYDHTGWCLTYPSEQMMDFVSWYDSSQHMESHEIHVPNHQAGSGV